MQYQEYIKQPVVENKFNTMFEEQKKYFKKKYSTLGIDGDRLESVAIKIAFVSTDIYFSELHMQESRN